MSRTTPESFVEVALPVPLDQTFTYLAPHGVKVEVGMRVLAPWGRRHLVGVVLAVHQQRPTLAAGQEIKLLGRVLDTAPVLDASVLALARWTASYYQAPLGEALRCALPPATEVRAQRHLRLTPRGEEALARRPLLLFKAGEAPAPSRSGQLMELLAAARAGVAAAGARRRFGAAVEAALRRKWLVESAESTAETGAPAGRVTPAYRLTAVGKEAMQGTLPKRVSAQQQAVLRQLAQAEGVLPRAALRAASASALATLQRQGWIERFSREAPPEAPRWAPRPRVQLNAAQREALEAIISGLPLGPDAGAAGKVVLLHGVTGSGKTAVYIAAIAATLERGLNALLLVPEIGLTPAVFADFEDAFPGAISIQHSGLSARERAQHWHRAQQGQARVVIGTRSAIFAPLPHLGLILVDEEHDGSYKQQESPRYHARDLAVLRGKLGGAAVVLGSATPSLESYAQVTRGRYRLVTLRQRVEQRPLPQIQLVDMRAEFQRTAAEQKPKRGQKAEETTFSIALLQALEDRLRRGEQSLILINRRGYAPVVMCRSCGVVVQCRDCALSLTFHKREHNLVCHVCGFTLAVPQRCPECGSEHIYFMGTGSEKVEEQLAAQLPRARIARLDRDTARGKRAFEQILGDFRAGNYDILVGTQMIAKGHDVPAVTLVGVINADGGLTFPEFRAAERTYQLLTQVAGRAGRGEVAGQVILQVLHPDHYALRAVVENDFHYFQEKEERFRRLLHYPPSGALAALSVRHVDLDRAQQFTRVLAAFLEAELERSGAPVQVCGPAPASVPRLKAEYRFQFLLKSPRRQALQLTLQRLRAFLRERRFPATAVGIDVDPVNLN
ncbi:MAG: replication restart helicase PriA [Terriglobales bacterium]